MEFSLTSAQELNIPVLGVLSSARGQIVNLAIKLAFLIISFLLEIIAEVVPVLWVFGGWVLLACSLLGGAQVSLPYHDPINFHAAKPHRGKFH